MYKVSGWNTADNVGLLSSLVISFRLYLLSLARKQWFYDGAVLQHPRSFFSVRFGQEHSMLYPLDLQSLYTHSNWGELYHALITLVLPYFPNWSGGLLSREKCFWLVDVNFPRGTTLQKYYSDLCSDMSWVWNFCAGVSYVILRGNQWWRREMRVFSHARNPYNALISAQKMANS